MLPLCCLHASLTPTHLHAECPAQEGASSHGQEEAAIFLRDSSFMQGAVGLTLMPPDAASRVSIKDLAALSCFLFGSDKSYGLFMSVGHRATAETF